MNEMTQRGESRFAIPVSDETVRAFQTDGAVCIRNAFTAQQISELTLGIERNLAHPSPRAKVASSPTDPGWFFEDFVTGKRMHTIATSSSTPPSPPSRPPC